MDIKVSESNDLKARVAYQGVINMIKNIFELPESEDESTRETGTTEQKIQYIQKMWERMQYQNDKGLFNMLLGVTALKTMGDYLQECQACFKWGGYVSNSEEFENYFINNRRSRKQTTDFNNNIKPKLIYRSVSKAGSVIPYDNIGNGLRLGIQGDRPSGFRSIYMLLNGEGGVNDQAITGYMFTSSTQNPSRTLLVSRNKGILNDNGLKGNVIYVTRELQTPDRDTLLRSLEFLNVKIKNRKVRGAIVQPEITVPTLSGSSDVTDNLLSQNQMTKLEPLKNSAYNLQLDYNKPYEPSQKKIELETELTQEESDKIKRKEELKRIKEEKARLDEQVKIAKNKINELRGELTEEEKKSPIPIDVLNKIKEQLSTTDNPIPEDVYDILVKEAKKKVKGGGYTRANKQKNKNKITKRANKNVNKLTKRIKKIKYPKKTRKNE
jgi:hypothetical protein